MIPIPASSSRNNMKILPFIMILAFSTMYGTELDTPIQKFQLPGVWLDVSLIGKKVDPSSALKVTVKNDQNPVVLMTEGKRTVMIESGMADKVNIGDGPTFHAYLGAKIPDLAKYKLADWDYYIRKKFGGKGLKFDMSIRLRNEPENGAKSDIKVASARYMEVDGVYVIFMALGSYADSKNDESANVNWQGYPERNPDIRTLFTQPVE